MRRMGGTFVVIATLALTSTVPAGINWLPALLGTIEHDAVTGDFTSYGNQVESSCDATSHRVAFWKFLVQPSLGILIGTFETDLNDPPATFTFDVTKIVRANKRRPLGFRVNTRDPFCQSANGTQFGDQLSGAWLDIRQ